MRYGKEADPFYTSAAWRKVRTLRLQMDGGMCQDCLKRWEASDGHGMRVAPATVVHHIATYQQHPELGLDLDNLVSLCAACHNQRHPERHANGRLQAREDKTRGGRIRVITIGRGD